MGKNQDPGSGINIPDTQHCIGYAFINIDVALNSNNCSFFFLGGGVLRIRILPDHRHITGSGSISRACQSGPWSETGSDLFEIKSTKFLQIYTLKLAISCWTSYVKRRLKMLGFAFYYSTVRCLFTYTLHLLFVNYWLGLVLGQNVKEIGIKIESRIGSLGGA